MLESLGALNVAVYYRVSTKGQGDDDRLGLPMQRQVVEAYCAAQGHRIVATFEDIGHSGATLDRPGLAALLAAAADGLFAGVVVYRWDRLARDTMLDGYIRFSLTKHSVRALSATETNGVDSISKLTQQILSSVAEYERSLITQRLSTSRKLRALEGGYAHGRPPYGWKPRRVGKHSELVPIGEEQATLAIMRELRAAKMTFAAIADELNARGLKPRRGERWRTSSVHYALTSDAQIARALNDPNSLRACDCFTALAAPDGAPVDDAVEAGCVVCDRALKEHPDAHIRALPAEKIDELRERAMVVSTAEQIALS